VFLKQTRYKNGRIYLSITEGYRKDGKVKSRTVEKCGFLDVLEKEYSDPIAHFKKRALELSEIQKIDNEPVTLAFYPKQRMDKRTKNHKNLGYTVLSDYYHKLGIDKFWKNRRSSNNFKYNPNAIFKLLTYSRALYPGSKRQAYLNKDIYLDNMDFSLDDMYRALSFFAKYEDDLIAWIDSKITEQRSRDTTCVFYDVTNFYFEIELEDELRRRGVGKEHRPNPIVQMGLAMDTDGLPMGYKLFEGNTNDCLTLMPVLKEMRARHKAEHIIVVADKGLNTSDNIAANVLDGNGFVFSQSVRRATKTLQNWVLDESGYKGNENFKIKDRIAKKTITVACKDGTKKKVDIEVREVAFWSRDFAKRSQSERAKVIEKSMATVARGGMDAAKSHTPIRYITDTAVVKKTGEAASHIYSLNEDKIKKDASFDGYYCIISNELDKTAEEIIDIYRGLWRIEETFRVTKSVIETRPVYVSRHDRIHAHFMTCYVALVLLRLLQTDLNWEHSAKEIADDLASITGIVMDKNYYLFGHRTDLSDKLGALSGIDLSLKTLSLQKMKEILAKSKKN
jgi:transposase